ncbi:isopenicillin N synthase family dioxygenase [Pseudonocardia sp. CA-142604]|uniref:isopenicillin N synthase family dioxygenase n=1 Tax=Pseudonocardia sp. CA-142604 TaxID=3240024 RepID=UPI003D8B5B0D
MTRLPIPLIDLARWRGGDPDERAALAAELDHALQESGFLLLAGHGIGADVRERIRTAARRFFVLPSARKAAYATAVGGRGWVGPGREVNSFPDETADAERPDLKESYTLGRDLRTGVAELDRVWFAENVWPAEVPELAALCTGYAHAVRRVYGELLQLSATALDLDADFFVRRTLRSPHTFNINRYPALSETGAPAEGQYRIGPHTDWGMITILDRQVGYGGLEVQAPDGTWVGAPHVPDAFTVNIGDLMARWTGNRWRSTRHRVLPPSPDAPHEELISLIMFLEADVDTVVTPLPAPIGRRGYPPVTAGDYLLERAAAATVS